MKHLLTFVLFSILCSSIAAQNGSIKGLLLDDSGTSLPYANVVLYTAADTTLVKIEVTDDVGIFTFNQIDAGDYLVNVSYISLEDLWIENVSLEANGIVDLETITMSPSSVQLETATVTARRAMVEVKADRKIFNVEGTINATGDNGVSLLRKAPGVVLDNNDNISVLGRAGVLIYVDGKRIPYEGQDLANYLRNIPSDQIDRVEIITNPGAKYEAEGNAGIIDIILKRDKSLGTNGSVNANYTFATKDRYVAGLNLNHRNKLLNAFGSLSYGDQGGFTTRDFDSFQNGFRLQEVTEDVSYAPQVTYKLGSDFYVGENHIVGFIVNGATNTAVDSSSNINFISDLQTPSVIDSTLRAFNNGESSRNDIGVNLNYRFKKDKTSINADVDYGSYSVDRFIFQPNVYFAGTSETDILSQNAQNIETPTDIIIRSAKIDFEQESLLGGTVGIGGKLSSIATDNTFLFSNIINNDPVVNNQRSNTFIYDEQVQAAYVSYARKLTDKLNMTSGLRMEHTDSVGDLTTFDPDLAEPAVEQDYFSWFPNLGFSYQLTPIHALSLSYGRRINRPDYSVLNPFRNQVSELSVSRGNAFLQPEIVNNVQLDYTLKYRYNFSLSYSQTTDQITRLIGPDEIDPKAGFISWDNLATQTVISANASLPFQFTDKWTAFFNLGTWHTDNQAVYENGATIDLQVWSWNTFIQSNYNFTKSFSIEMSSWVSGPGVWGGVFRYEPQWSVNFGVQKKFFNNRLIAKVSVQDPFFTAGWSGVSEFNGLVSSGNGNWDSRRLAFNLNYKFGNDQVKGSKRKTGIEAESKRAGGED